MRDCLSCLLGETQGEREYRSEWSGRPEEEGGDMCECDMEEVVRVDGGGEVSRVESFGQDQVAETGHTHQRKRS